jgi:hypothetical protein
VPTTNTPNLNVELYKLKLTQYGLDKNYNIDKAYALGMTALLPGAGHIYAGDPARGGSFVFIELFCLGVNALASADFASSVSDEQNRVRGAVINISAFGYMFFKILEMYDVMLTVDEKNKKLRDELGLTYNITL